MVSRPFKKKRWKKRLDTHPDCYDLNMILDIIEYRVKIGYQSSLQQIWSKNLFSAINVPDIIFQDLENQIKYNWVSQVDILPAHFISSPLGLMPKPNGR